MPAELEIVVFCSSCANGRLERRRDRVDGRWKGPESTAPAAFATCIDGVLWGEAVKVGFSLFGPDARAPFCHPRCPSATSHYSPWFSAVCLARPSTPCCTGHRREEPCRSHCSSQPLRQLGRVEHCPEPHGICEVHNSPFKLL